MKYNLIFIVLDEFVFKIIFLRIIFGMPDSANEEIVDIFCPVSGIKLSDLCAS